MVICLERGADLHIAQLMPLPLNVSCFSKFQIGFTFLVPAHPGSPGKRAVKRVCVCVVRHEDSVDNVVENSTFFSLLSFHKCYSQCRFRPHDCIIIHFVAKILSTFKFC